MNEVQQVAEPASKPSDGFLTLKYLSASASVVLSIVVFSYVVQSLFFLWTKAVGDGYSLGAFVSSSYQGIITNALLVLSFALIAWLMFINVTRMIKTRPDYLNTLAYVLITNATLGALLFMTLVGLANLASVLLSSLVLIGSGADIGAMYLGTFLPQLIATLLSGFASFVAFKIAKGKNLSSILGIVLVSVAGAALVAAIITVAVQSHTSASSDQKIKDSVNDYLNSYNSF